ncbi:Hypothetical protein R9X50_00228800 [Acrodontium crateriforme]|uniref:Inositol hexakisphosphate and diphosphoinositol-pentakisphosphate kinase n=1 Tax=Acrodontium crateriforme TaxID=150365 RepID=A0AAQ3R6I4_9PEZI|nr:Hypothetical protein R9X50_00228800 [Acrodontium crateriforme]
MDSLRRSTSFETSRSQSSSHILSAAANASTSRKSRHAEPEIDTTTGDTDRASLSMPPHHVNTTLRAPTNSSRQQSKPSGPAMDNTEGARRQSNGSKEVDTDAKRINLDPPVNRMSFSSLYNPGRNLSSASSVTGGSDQETLMASDTSDRATTATHAFSVTTSSQNGQLSPAATNLQDQLASSASSIALSTSPGPGRTQARNHRGRTQTASRRVSLSNPNSASTSADRSNTTNPNHIGSLGVCALDAKARSKPARNILNRLVGRDAEFDVIIFGDKVILDEPIENWPKVDFLISFFSDGFPLEKAIAYAKLRKPFCVNDLPMQTILWDRRLCLTILDRLGVPTPKRVEVNRDGGPVILTTDIAQRVEELCGVRLVGSEDGRGGGQKPPTDVHMEDDDDTLVVDGQRLRKPFVEKPVSGEDHNINIYYPTSQGGGGRRLFRKVNNKSSAKDDGLIVPRAVTEPEASYIYEQFLKVENAEDVKAYTVGPDYCHAETRKSPVVDGVVKRNPNGKEIRYVTSLTKEEQISAAKIARGFGQFICGFDLLRVEDQSYVIDVNGWSFVKDNNDYYDQCAKILRALFIREKLRVSSGRVTPSDVGDERDARELMPPPSIPASFTTPEKSISRKGTLSSSRETGGHRNALKSVFRSRSISTLRESVNNAANRFSGTPTPRSPSGANSPLTSPPSFERATSIGNKRPVVVPNVRDASLPPPAVSSSLVTPRGAEEPRLDSGDQLEIPQTTESETTIPAPASKSQWRLKGMVAVIRHADRTPKQKFKFTFHTKPFVDLLKGHREEVLLVGEAALASVEHAVQQALDEGIEDGVKLRTLRNALQKKKDLPGTKVQIKPMFKKPKDKSKEKDDDKDKNQSEKKEETEKRPVVATEWRENEISKAEKPSKQSPPEVPGSPKMANQQRSDSLSEVTMSRTAAAENNLVFDKLQLVMKWGGEPTHSARYQSADLGENMRNDLLLMNRDALSDVAVFASSERRVKTSAQIFASAFLDRPVDLDDGTIEIRKDLLDDSNAAKDEMDKVKKKLKGLLRKGYEAPDQFAWPKNGTPEPYVVVRQVVELMRFHRRVMRANFSKLAGNDAVSSLEKIRNPGSESVDPAIANGAPVGKQVSSVQSRWCTGEDADLFKERWEKLFDEFTDAEKVDPSRISELYDSMKFDALHNRQFLEWVFTPSKTILAEVAQKKNDGEEALQRTESQTAREEYAHTHESTQPAVAESDATDHLGPPARSNTAISDSSARSITTEKERVTLSQRIGLSRRSQDMLSGQRNSAILDSSTADEPNGMQSYFNLYRGDSNTIESKAKNDVRLEQLNKLYSLCKILFDFIGPQEYGITDGEKLEIGLLTSLPLLKEIVRDLEEVQASDDAKAFIYFTKESHIYTLLNCILEGGIHTKIARNAIPELDYLSQICFELYESANSDPQPPSTDGDAEIPAAFNYSIRITISPGCHTFDPLDVQLDSKHCIGCAPRRSLTAHGQWNEVLETLRAKFHTVKLPKSFTAINLSEKVPDEFSLDQKEKGTEEGESVGIDDGKINDDSKNKSENEGLVGGVGEDIRKD